MSFSPAKQLNDLLDKRAAVEFDLSSAKAALAAINENIAAVGGPLADSAYSKADKIAGTVSFALEDQIFKATIDKTVKWDSAKLQSIAGGMSFEDATGLFKIEFSVPEKNFSAVMDKELLAKLTDARTVTYSKPKITKAD